VGGTALVRQISGDGEAGIADHMWTVRELLEVR